MAEQMMKTTRELTQVLQGAVDLCTDLHQQFITPEHFLYELSSVTNFEMALSHYDIDAADFQNQVFDAIITQEQEPKDKSCTPQLSEQSRHLMLAAANQAFNAGHDTVDVTHFSEALS